MAQKLLLKTKGTNMVLENVTPSSYWIQRFYFCEGLSRPGRKLKESASRMKNKPSIIVLKKYVDWADTRFETMLGLLVKTPLGNVLY